MEHATIDAIEYKTTSTTLKLGLAYPVYSASTSGVALVELGPRVIKAA